ncbi:ATP-binding protein [Streptomyces filamentosus]|uniref:ATP-binding protein n=1 Tax=Streptomyces filamentosus TaxID=67294 RepID=UPI0037F6D315
MAFRKDGVPELRRVLPFDAVPGEFSLLRRAVRSTLGDWGVLNAADEAELVVTELATNVMKHVGEGVPATLVLEPRGSRLRVELHDTSTVVPKAEREATCDSECGRGLHLLASMSADWGTLLTGTGKVVWCELALVADAPCFRAQRAQAAISAYREILGARSLGQAVGSRVDQESAVTLIADVIAWLMFHGGDPDEAILQAQQLYEMREAS